MDVILTEVENGKSKFIFPSLPEEVKGLMEYFLEKRKGTNLLLSNGLSRQNAKKF